MRLTPEEIDRLHVGMTLFGTGEHLGKRFKKQNISLPSFQWQQIDDVNNTPPMMRGSLFLSKLDLETKKPRTKKVRVDG